MPNYQLYLSLLRKVDTKLTAIANILNYQPKNQQFAVHVSQNNKSMTRAYMSASPERGRVRPPPAG